MVQLRNLPDSFSFCNYKDNFVQVSSFIREAHSHILPCFLSMCLLLVHFFYLYLHFVLYNTLQPLSYTLQWLSQAHVSKIDNSHLSVQASIDLSMLSLNVLLQITSYASCKLHTLQMVESGASGKVAVAQQKIDQSYLSLSKQV